VHRAAVRGDERARRSDEALLAAARGALAARGEGVAEVLRQERNALRDARDDLTVGLAAQRTAAGLLRRRLEERGGALPAGEVEPLTLHNAKLAA
jgi:hypothetical protein